MTDKLNESSAKLLSMVHGNYLNNKNVLLEPKTQHKLKMI